MADGGDVFVEFVTGEFGLGEEGGEDVDEEGPGFGGSRCGLLRRS